MGNLQAMNDEHYPADLQWRDGGYDTFCACGVAWPCRHYSPPPKRDHPCDPKTVTLAMTLWRLNFDPDDAEQGWPDLYAAAEDDLQHRAGTSVVPREPDGQPPTWTVGSEFHPEWLPARYGYFIDVDEATPGTAYVRRWDQTGPVFRQGQTVGLDDRGNLVEVSRCS